MRMVMALPPFSVGRPTRAALSRARAPSGGAIFLRGETRGGLLL